MKTDVQLKPILGNIEDTYADVLALKYAQGHHGADRLVVERMEQVGLQRARLEHLREGQHLLLLSLGAVPAERVLFVSAPPLSAFSYRDARELSETILFTLFREAPKTTSVAMTIHGPGFGLDEIECTQQLIEGLRIRIMKGDFPECLETIFLVERDPARFDLMAKVIAKFFKKEMSSSYSLSVQSAPEAVGKDERDAKRIFVAMPFHPGMRDVWTFGIQQTVRGLGMLCERLDEEAFVGDILNQIKVRIEESSMVIADISGSNPNVMLEVGYAWGKGRETLLLCKDGEKLPFDVANQRCILYKDVTHLQEELKKFLGKLPMRSTATA